MDLVTAQNLLTTAAPIPADNTLPAVFAIAAFAAYVLCMCVLLLPESTKPLARWCFNTIVLSCALMVIGGLTGAVISSVIISDEHRTSVTSWLNESYGIVADSYVVGKLTDGESIAVDYEGDRTVIKLISSSGGGLIAVDAEEKILDTIN